MKRSAALWIASLWAAGASAQQFVDLNAKSGLAFRTKNDFRGRKYFPQPLAGGVAVLDYDGDGLLDIFFTNGAKLPELRKADRSFHHCLLRNLGNGGFEDVTERARLAGSDLGFSFGAAAGDFDNDGHPDLFVTNAGANTLYRNQGDGTFRDVTAGSGLNTKPANTLSVHAAWVDYDGDGRLDVAVADYTVWTPATDKRCLRGEQEMYCTPKTYGSVPQRLYRNVGGGRFEDVTVKSGIGSVLGKGMGIGVADYNGDGRMDLFFANDTERNFLFLNQGDGTFKEVGLLWGVAYNDSGATVSAMGADAKDFDNDGRPDIFYNDLMGQIWGLFLNRGGRMFDYVSAGTRVLQLSQPFSGWSAGFVDYNNDGWKDLYSANGDVDNLVAQAAQHDTMFQNVGGKQYQHVSAAMGTDFNRVGFQRGAAFADFNNDGWMDLVVTSLNERPRILMNAGGTGHWLVVGFKGRLSNRDGIGARVTVTTASGRKLYNHGTTSVGFLSSSDPRVHFGLGEETTLAEVEIGWPSGIVQRLGGMKADQIVTVEEPQK